MREIIKVEDALAWFEENRKFESKYRKTVNCNMPANFHISDEPVGYYSQLTATKDFEHDSAPETWKHYYEHYIADSFVISEDNDDTASKYCLSHLKYQYCGRESGKYYVLFAVQNHNISLQECERLPRGSCNLRGDCDFNFNYDKYPRFLEKLFNGAVTKKEIELLIKCHDMHHTLLNFSLMQCLGGLNNLKGCFLRIDCEDGEEKKPERLDRLDKFVTFLKEYFEIVQSDEEERLKKLKAGQRGSNNAEYLRDYLDQFDNIYDYCAKIYFLPTEDYYTGMMEEKKVNPDNLNDKTKDKWKDLLDYNKNLIDDLLKLGSTSLTEDKSVKLKFSYQNEEKECSLRDRVVEYMLLAVRFWQAKEKYFELMDKIFEDEKKK